MAKLEDSTKGRYINGWQKCLDALAEKKSEYASDLLRISNMFKAIDLLDNSIEINDKSGFIKMEAMQEISIDKEKGTETLRRIPKKDEILEKAKEKLYAGEFPGAEQQEYKTRKYLEYLVEHEMPELKKSKKVEYVEGNSKYDILKIYVSGFDVLKDNLWLKYEIKVAQEVITVLFNFQRPPIWRLENDKKSLAMSQDLLNALERMFAWDAKYVFESFQNLREVKHGDKLKPLEVRRAKLGPFYCQETKNPEGIDKIIREHQESFILCFEEDLHSSKDGREKDYVFVCSAEIKDDLESYLSARSQESAKRNKNGGAVESFEVLVV